VIRRLEHGDVLVVTRLDWLAPSTRDLLNILDAVAKPGAGFKSLKDRWHGRLMLTVLGGLAEFERVTRVASQNSVFSSHSWRWGDGCLSHWS
jgi:DNA invertase Pin-like site-specific DNA recombinase